MRQHGYKNGETAHFNQAAQASLADRVFLSRSIACPCNTTTQPAWHITAAVIIYL